MANIYNYIPEILHLLRLRISSAAFVAGLRWRRREKEIVVSVVPHKIIMQVGYQLVVIADAAGFEFVWSWKKKRGAKKVEKES